MNKRYSKKTQIVQKRQYVKENFMKKIFRIILSILILCQLMCSFSACQNSISSDEKDDNDFNVNLELTDDSEKIYSYVKKAWDNSAAYTGAYTVKLFGKFSEDGETNIMTKKISMDPQRKLFFSEDKEGDDPYDYEKIFPNPSGTYYYYNGKNFYSMSDSQANCEIFEIYQFKDVYLGGEMVGSLPNLSMANKLSELRAAYNEVISDTCNSPESKVLKATAKITPSANKETYSLFIEMLIEYKDGTKNSCQIEILAQNHKLVRITYSGEAGKYGEKIEEEAEYIYEFDQIGYDAIEGQVPNVTTRYNSGKSINFYFKNSTLPITGSTGRVYDSDQKITIESAYELILKRSNFNLDNYTWYTDMQLTKPFDPTSVSDEEWFSLENLYAGKYTGNSVVIEYQLRHDVNKAYSIVMGINPSSRSGGHGGTVGTNFYYSELLPNEDKNKDMEIYLNGVKQAKGSQYFEIDGSQAVYKVELVYKSDYWLW